MNLIKKNWLATAILLAALAFGGFYVVQNQTDQKTDSGENTTVDQNKAFGATLEINDGKGVQHYDLLEIVVGQTALEITKNATGGQVETQGEGANAFVTSINGRKSDTSKNEFWELVVNGKPAEVGAGSYKIQKGDKIEWRISTY